MQYFSYAHKMLACSNSIHIVIPVALTRHNSFSMHEIFIFVVTHVSNKKKNFSPRSPFFFFVIVKIYC